MTTPPYIFQDSNWVVLNKPSNISTHGAFEGDLAAQEWLQLHFNETTYVCSRLDKSTSGVLPLARTKEASAQAQHVHESGLAHKTYFLLSHQELETHSWTRDDALDGKPAQTLFRKIRRVGKNTLYEASITRGKKHQIRRHAALSNIPILGDVEYGGEEAARLYLHCQRVQWPGCVPWETEVPKSFQSESSGLWEALEVRGNWLPAITTAWRAIQRGEIPECDFSLDIYNNHACVWVYDSRINGGNFAESSLANMVQQLIDHLHLAGAVVKFPQKNPHQQGLVRDTLLLGSAPEAQEWVQEHGLQFLVAPQLWQHVGLFLDQRDSRQFVRVNSANRRCANLFSYTCSFSLAMLAGGAEVVFSVDTAKKWLGVGLENVRNNGFEQERRGKFVCEDVRVWLERLQRKIAKDGPTARLGMVVCDPPTFSASEKGEFHVLDDWDGLAASVSSVLSVDGVALFSTNHRAGQRDRYSQVLKRHFAEVIERSPPLDFPIKSGCSPHVHLFTCRL